MAKKYNIGDAELRVSPSTTGFKKKLEALLEAMGNVVFDVQIEPDWSHFIDELDSGLKIIEKATKLHIEMALDTATATAEFKAWQAEHNKTKLQTDVSVRTAAATARYKTWLASQQGKDIDVDVDVDNANANRKLQDTQREIRKTQDGARVVQNFQGIQLFSLSNIAMAATGISGIVGMVGGLAAAAAAAGTALGAMGATLAVGGSGIIGAFTALKDEAGAAGTAAQDSADDQQAAADRIADAHDNLRSSLREVSNAQEDVNQAVRDATRDYRDLRMEVTDTAISQQEAQVALARARSRLRQTEADRAVGKASNLDVTEAKVGVTRARFRLTESKVNKSDANMDFRDAKQAGGPLASKQVTDAQQRQDEAIRASVRATRDLARAQQEATRTAQDQAGAQSALDKAMAKLSPNAKEFVNAMRALGPEWTTLRKAVQDKLFEGMGAQVTQVAKKQLPELQRGMVFLAGVANNVLGKTMQTVSNTFSEFSADGTFTAFLGAVQASFKNFAPVIDSLVRALTHLTIGIGPALGDMFGKLANYINGATPFFTRLGTVATGEFGKMLDIMLDFFVAIEPILISTMPILTELFAGLTKVLHDNQDAIVGLGQTSGDSMLHFLDVLSNLIPPLIFLLEIVMNFMQLLPANGVAWILLGAIIMRSLMFPILALGNSIGRTTSALRNLSVMKDNVSRATSRLSGLLGTTAANTARGAAATRTHAANLTADAAAATRAATANAQQAAAVAAQAANSTAAAAATGRHAAASTAAAAASSTAASASGRHAAANTATAASSTAAGAAATRQAAGTAAAGTAAGVAAGRVTFLGIAMSTMMRRALLAAGALGGVILLMSMFAGDASAGTGEGSDPGGFNAMNLLLGAMLLPMLWQAAKAMKLVAAAQAVWTAATRVLTTANWGLVASLLANPITWIVIGIVALIAAIVLIATKTDWFQKAWNFAWSAIKAGLQAAWTYIQIVFNLFMALLSAAAVPIRILWEGIKFLGTLWMNVFKACWEVVKMWWGFVQMYFGIVKDIFMGFIDFFANIFTGNWKGAWDAVTKTFEGVVGRFKDFFGTIGNGFKGLLEIGKNVGKGIYNAFRGVVDVIKEPIRYIGKLLKKLPKKIGPFSVPGVSTLHQWGDKLEKLRTGGQVAGRKADGMLWGPGSGTSDSIMGVDVNGTPQAMVSAGEYVVNERSAKKHAGLIQAINSDSLPHRNAGGWIGVDGLPHYDGGGQIGSDNPNQAFQRAGSPDQYNTAWHEFLIKWAFGGNRNYSIPERDAWFEQNPDLRDMWSSGVLPPTDFGMQKRLDQRAANASAVEFNDAWFRYFDEFAGGNTPETRDVFLAKYPWIDEMYRSGKMPPDGWVPPTAADVPQTGQTFNSTSTDRRDPKDDWSQSDEDAFTDGLSPDDVYQDGYTDMPDDEYMSKDDPNGYTYDPSGGTVGSGTAEAYGLVNASDPFPQWVMDLGAQHGVTPSTYAGHQSDDRAEAGYAPNPDGLNRGIDWTGDVSAMHSFAEFLFREAPNVSTLEQIIWQNPGTGQKIGWYGRSPDTDGSYYAANYGGHQDHVHTRHSGSFVADNAVPADNADGLGFGDGTGADGFDDSMSDSGEFDDLTYGDENSSDYDDSSSDEDAIADKLSVPKMFGKAGEIFGAGLLDFFGLGSSILSGDNVYNKAVTDTMKESEAARKRREGSSGESSGKDGDKARSARDGEYGPDEIGWGGLGDIQGTMGGAGDVRNWPQVYDPSQGAEQWRDLMAAVFQFGGFPMSNLDIGIEQMQDESGGNPNAINNDDINAQNGTPSIGLLQVISTTFEAYRHDELKNDQRDPAASIYAGTNYAINEYQPDLTGVWGSGAGGYATGGPVFGKGGPTSDQIKAMLSHGEFVMNAATTSAGGWLMGALNDSPEFAGQLSALLGSGFRQAPASVSPIGAAPGRMEAPAQVQTQPSINIDTVNTRSDVEFVKYLERKQAQDAIVAMGRHR